MIAVHGRGASAESILALAGAFNQPDWAYLAPQANGATWYPYSFLAPLEDNEPGLSSALGVLDDIVTHINEQGIPTERIMLMGFSQGACLAAEYAARHAQRFGGLAVFSGGLIGPDGTPRDYDGSLDGTPVFIGCSDVDAHIPLARVKETSAVLARMGAQVDERIYPGMGHTVTDEEIAAVREMMTALDPA
jgi:predicted esterase